MNTKRQVCVDDELCFLRRLGLVVVIADEVAWSRQWWGAQQFEPRFSHESSSSPRFEATVGAGQQWCGST